MIFFWGKKKKKADQPAPDGAPALNDEANAGAEFASEPQTPAAVSDPAVPDANPTEPTSFPPENNVVAGAEPRVARPEQAAEPPPEAPSPTDPAEAAPEPAKRGLFGRISDGLKRSSSRLGDGVSAIFTKKKLDDDALEALEELLLSADLGAGPTTRVIAKLAKDKFDKQVSDLEIKEALAEEVASVLGPHERDIDLSGEPPQVVVFVGVNGSGKTTTLGKIAAMVRREGRDAVLGAGDTFRAAAIEQIKVWGERADCPVVARDLGADAAGLAFDAYAEARTRGADLLLLDTAGRLQNKAELMDELKKVVRVLKKQDETAPHHVLLVLDATVGQNALGQVEAFKETAGVTGLIMTKLDGTAKGGVLVAIADKYPDLPIYFTGVGEGVDDLQPFSARHFARALAGLDAETEPA